MTIALVGSAVSTPNSGSTSDAVGTITGITAGNGILVCVSTSVNITSVTESTGSTPILLKAQTCTDAPTFQGALYFIPNVTGGSHTVTANFGSNSNANIVLQEVSGLFTPTVDKTAGNGGFSSTINTGSTGTLTQAVELAIALATNCNSNFTATKPSGWTQIAGSSYQGSGGFSLIYQVTAATTALNPAWTTPGGNYEMTNVIATLIPGAAPPAATLTTPTPSGTLSTAFSATPGATTNTSGGTGYCVVTTSSLSGVTAAQVKAGQNAAGSTTGVFSSTGPIAATGAFVLNAVTGLSASTTYNYAVVETTAGGDSNVVTGTFTTAPPPPTVTGLSSTTPIPGSSLTITGTAFNGTQSGGSVAIGGVNQTVTSWTDTSIVITVVQGTLLYGATNLTVTNGVTGSQSAGFSCTLSPPAGWTVITIGTPDTTSTNRITTNGAGGDLASGDQVAYGNIQGTGSFVINTDGTWIADPGITAFDFKVGTVSSGYGSVATNTLGPGASGLKNVVVHTFPIKASSDTKFYSQYPNGDHP